MSRGGAAPRTRAWGLRSPRMWVGLAVTVVTVWLSLRGVSFAALARDLRKADLLILLAYSLPAHLLTLWVRAVRWRHLTDAVQPIAPGPLFRATAIGFMVNNLVPLRVGEVVRVWSLARETGASGAALLGTVLLERLIDVIVVLGLASVLLGSRGGALPLSGSVLLILLVPVGLVAVLRVAPERAVRWVGVLRWIGVKEALVAWVQRLVRSFAEGLGSLRGGRHLFWIAFHSAVIWGVLSPIPFFGALEALHVELPLSRQLAASYVTLVAVGVAVALPSAPGFFGPFHFAARLALTRFGLDDATALAVGTLAHAAFWVIVTGIGLVVLRFRRTSLDETLEAAQAEPE